MLLANIAVARQLRESFPGRSLLRRHPAPSQQNLQRLVVAAASADIQLDVGSSRALAESLDKAAAAQQYVVSFRRSLPLSSSMFAEPATARTATTRFECLQLAV